VAEPDPLSIGDLWRPKFSIGQDHPVLTMGSCFAANIGRALLECGMNWRVAELAPPGLTATERRERQYGVFSFRTGNIYTAAALRQWLAWAFGECDPPDEYWLEDNRYYDPFRPSVEPAGYASAADLVSARERTLAAIRTGFADAHCLIFTLGLTEAWRARAGGAVYQVCPGTVHGTFDASRHEFHNYTFAEVYRDLVAAIALSRMANPGLRVVLTVSPVPLTATATAEHALVATTYSKSVLRAVAGQLAEEDEFVDYFPSYELVTGAPFRARSYAPNLRTVTTGGVAFVMRHFISALSPFAFSPVTPPDDDEDALCDDAVLDYYKSR
jgi:hypothetical protein